MKTISYLFYFATFLIFSMAQAETRPVDESTRQALEALGTESHGLTRSLLTPPYGAIPQDVQRLREEITKMFIELGGADLQKFSGQWVVNIYGDSAPNAWVKNLFQEERTWSELKKDISYRQAMKLNSGSTPIYEFGFSAGLFNKLQSKDQLAFIIGHELTHLLENHLDSESGRVSSQQHEIIADAESIRRMVGKYDLKAGASIMSLIMTPKEAPAAGNLVDMVLSAASSHHHEGQRISALQFTVEHYLRSQENAQLVRHSTPFPESLRIHSRESRTKPDSIFATSWVKYYNEVLTEVFLKNMQVSALMQDEKGSGVVEQPSHMASPTKKQKADLIMQILRTIEESTSNKTIRMNAFLQTFSLMSAQSFQSFSFADLSSVQIQEVTRFLLRQSMGADAWRYSDYQSIERDMQPKARLALNAVFLGSTEGQLVIERLTKTSPEWNRFFHGLYDMRRFYKSNGAIDSYLFEKEFIRTERAPEGRAAKAYLQYFITSVKAIQWGAAIPRFSILEGWAAAGDVQKLKTKELFETLKIGQDLFRGDAIALRKEILQDARRSDLLFNTQYRYSDDHLKIATQLLNDPSLSAQDRKGVFYLLSLFIDKNGLAAGSVYAKAVEQYLNSLSRDERIQLLTERPPVLESYRQTVLKVAKTIPAGELIGQGEAFYEAMEATAEKGFDQYLTLQRAWASFKTNALRLFNYGQQQVFIDSLTPAEVQKVFAHLEIHQRDLLQLDTLFQVEQEKLSHNTAELQRFGDANSILVKMIIRNIHTMSFPEFQQRWANISEIFGTLNTISQSDRLILEKYINDKMLGLSAEARYSVVRDPHLNSFLSVQRISEVLVEQVDLKAGKNPSLEKLANVVSEVSDQAELKSKTEIHGRFRNLVSERWGLQPVSVRQVFPSDERTATQKTSEVQVKVRGLSALLAAMRGQSVVDQMQMIDFLMGRAEKWPAFIDKLDVDLQATKASHQREVSLISNLIITRDDMQVRSELERSALVNSFLTGPTGLISDAKNLSLVSERILSAVSAQNRDFAKIMLEALYQAEGANKSVFLSYVLAQKSSSGALSEPLVLKSLLDAYGVPGVKLAQYLSFTDEFKIFKSTLESYQDAALPLSYFEMLELIEERLGKKWNPEKFHIVKIIGTGSVNVAVEYIDLETGKVGVMNLSRQNITTKTSEDFHRFNILLKALSENPVHGRKFDFVAGLMGIIKNSVSLEFDKKHAFDVQREVQALYNRNINGWKVRTVDAYGLEGMTILMQKAPGVGARHLQASEPEVYRSAMKALLAVEDGILRGVGADSTSMPVALHANPDLHDGQVLIDTKAKIVTILDFGQAERISNTERQLAIELLRFISGIDSVKSAKATLDLRFKEMNIQGREMISEKFLSEVLQRTDRMDRFVRLASGLNQRGFNVPLSSIHWVLAVNRAVKLGQKIGVPLEASYRNLLLTTKVGLSLKTYNKAASIFRPLPASQKAAAPLCSQVFSF